MQIDIIAPGRVKERYLRDAIDEYSKRLSRYCKLNIIEVADEKTPVRISYRRFTSSFLEMRIICYLLCGMEKRNGMNCTSFRDRRIFHSMKTEEKWRGKQENGIGRFILTSATVHR